MIEKVDVRNEKMYISIISVRQMEAYVKSWVSLILGVRWARKQLLVRGDTTPCVDSTQSLCGLHTQTGAGGAGAGRGGAGGSRKVWRHGILLPPTHTHTPKIANPRCGWIIGRPEQQSVASQQLPRHFGGSQVIQCCTHIAAPQKPWRQSES